MKPKLYIAAPLFSQAELSFNTTLKESLTPYFAVFLPQEDGGLIVQYVADGMPREAAVRRVFETDLQAVSLCDVLLIVLDGRSTDEGACFELGVAYGLGKLCIGLQTDPRRLLPTGNNPMLEAALYRCFTSIDELMQWIRTAPGELAVLRNRS